MISSYTGRYEGGVINESGSNIVWMFVKGLCIDMVLYYILELSSHVDNLED